jgi:hypothetical protein
MFDSQYLGAWDLVGRDVTVTIREVEAGKLTAPGGRTSKKPVIYFQGKEKGLALNKTNAKIVAAMYGTDTEHWVGQQITIYPTKTEMQGETVDCIRVRPGAPSKALARRAAEGEYSPPAGKRSR